MSTGYFHEVGHTADLSLYACGADLAELFVHAAQGMCSLMPAQPAAHTQRLVRALKLDAPDAETLLVDWLGELLYLAESEHAQWDAFEVLTLTAEHLEALVWGQAPCTWARGIKAVTYYDLAITRSAVGLYEVTLTFDV
jgi:SHS2 domain-containing protein